MSLEKIANNQELSKLDIITAAHELAEFEKDAEAAEAEGRAAANELVDELSGEAMEKDAEAEDEEELEEAAHAAAAEIVDEEEADEEEAEAAAAAATAAGSEKRSSVDAQTEISEAVEVLKRHGVIK